MAKYQKKASVGKWLKKGEDYNDGDLLQIANEGQKIEGTFGTQDVFLMKTKDGIEASMSFNQTSLNNIIDAYGEDSITWVGKKVKVWLILQSVSGKMQKVPYLTHPSAEMVDGDSGVRFEIPGRQVEPPQPKAKPAGYPEEVINPDDIPF